MYRNFLFIGFVILIVILLIVCFCSCKDIKKMLFLFFFRIFSCFRHFLGDKKLIA